MYPQGSDVFQKGFDVFQPPEAVAANFVRGREFAFSDHLVNGCGTYGKKFFDLGQS
jgi:hypothetical protein